MSDFRCQQPWAACVFAFKIARHRKLTCPCTPRSRTQCKNRHQRRYGKIYVEQNISREDMVPQGMKVQA